MQDNFTQDSTIEQLIKFLDGELSGSDKKATELLLQSNEAVRERYENLVAAKDAVRLKGIQQRVQSLHQQFYPLASTQQASNDTAKIIKASFGSRFKMVVSIAAIFIVLISSFVMYEFNTTTSDSVYADNFMNYQLPVLRGEGSLDNLDSLFNAGNFTAVIRLTETKQELSQKNYFILGLSYLQTGNATEAIAALQSLQKINNSSNAKEFVDESDYYLALAYIKAGNINEAQTTLDKITSNPRHMYYAKAKEISKTSLTILKWKQ